LLPQNHDLFDSLSGIDRSAAQTTQQNGKKQNPNGQNCI
jgi:hypothetical protein